MATIKTLKEARQRIVELERLLAEAKRGERLGLGEYLIRLDTSYDVKMKLLVSSETFFVSSEPGKDPIWRQNLTYEELLSEAMIIYLDIAWDAAEEFL